MSTTIKTLDLKATKNGHIIQHHVPTGKRWRVMYGYGYLVCGVTVATRSFILTWRSPGGVILYSPMFMGGLTATQNSSWSLGGQAPTTGLAGHTANGSDAYSMIAEHVLEEDDYIEAFWENFLVAEDDGNGVLRVEEFDK